MSVIKYNLDYINQIKNQIDDLTIDNEIKIVIDNIVKQINSPGYTKTPIFKTYNKNNNKRYNQGKYQKNNQDWVEVRNFKSTKLKKSEGDDKIIDKLRININKITDKTYHILSKDIFKLLDEISEDSFLKISKSIFDIISKNKFYSNIYAKLYSELIYKYSNFKIILNNNIGNFIEECKKISYCEPEENYDLFCENNKINEQRRAMLLFYVNTHKHNIIDDNIIYNLISDIQNIIDKNLNLDKSKMVEELFELLFISITNLDKSSDSKYIQIIDFIKIKSKLKISDYKAFTNKSKFKCMDILDLINKK
jgi:hypothetical protein